MSDQQKMAQMAQMMQQMAGTEKTDSSRISQVNEGETTTWGDGRMTGRFNKPSNNPFKEVTGTDPLKKLLHKSRAKPTPLDMDDIHTALLKPGIYDSNFYPLHDVIAHPYWSDHDKVGVLKKCLMFGADANQRNANQETPLLYALNIRDSKLAKLAAMALIEHGTELNTLDKNGFKALHHVMHAGHPDLIPAMIARQATHGTTATGLTLSQLALDRFTRSMQENVVNDPERFETALNTYYKSMAYVKSYKLYQGEFSMDEHRKKLLDASKKQPGYRKFIDDVEKKISAVQTVQNLPKARTSRPYTNPGNGFNYRIEDGKDAHAWLGGFSALMNKMAGGLAKDAYLIRSKNRMTELLNKPELINNSNVINHLRGERQNIDIDYVLMDAKTNPNGDTLLTRLARTSNVAGISTLVDMNANLNAQDFEGNTAMHLLVDNCQSKEQLLAGLKHLVGVPDAEGKIATLGGGKNYADREIVNAQGQTFMDVLQEKHPEWVNEFSRELGSKPLKPNLAELELSKVLMLEGPEGMLRLERNPDPYLLMDETIPKLQPLSSVATEHERNRHVEHFAQALIKIQVLKATASPEKTQELNIGAEQILNEQTADTKMQACILFAQDENPDSHKLNAQAMLLNSLGHVMRNGTQEEQRLMFDTFEKTDEELQYRITTLLKAQSVTMSGERSKLGEEDQPKFDAAVSNLQAAATSFENNMGVHARAKYEIAQNEVHNQDKPKSDRS